MLSGLVKQRPQDLPILCGMPLPPACARGHHPDGPKANHALTFKLDHSSGAAHTPVLHRESKQLAFVKELDKDVAPA